MCLCMCSHESFVLLSTFLPGDENNVAHCPTDLIDESQIECKLCTVCNDFEVLVVGK